MAAGKAQRLFAQPWGGLELFCCVLNRHAAAVCGTGSRVARGIWRRLPLSRFGPRLPGMTTENRHGRTSNYFVIPAERSESRDPGAKIASPPWIEVAFQFKSERL